MSNNKSNISIDETLKVISDAMESVLDAIFLQKNSLDQLIEEYSKTTDKFIIQTEEERKVTFVGGEFFVEQKVHDSYEARANLYFKNSNGKWEVVSLKNKFDGKGLTESAIKELDDKKEFKYTVAHPNR